MSSAYAAVLASLLFSFAVSVKAQTTVPDPVVRAKNLVEHKSPDEAYKLLAPLEMARGGDAEYDYWLGVAAFMSNRVERAALAFERALVVNADFDAARMELGRTYLRMGSYDLAEQEFKRLLTRVIEPQIKSGLDNYLNEIAKARAKERFAFNTYVEFGAGHDNNLSSSTRNFTGAVLNSFGIAGIAPTGNSIQHKASYGSLGTGFDLTNRYVEDRTIYAAANIRGRFHGNQTDFNYLLVDATAGHEWRLGERAVALGGFVQRYDQDGASDPLSTIPRNKNDRTMGGINADWRTPAGKDALFTVGLQAATVRYRTNESQNTDQLTATFAWQNTPSSWKGASLSVAGFYTKDRAKNRLGDALDTDVSRNTVGTRFAYESDPRSAVAWVASVGWLRRTDANDFARAPLVRTGRDNLMDIGVKFSWRIAQAWTLQPYVAYIRNSSNISLYSFNKTDAGIVLRLDFK